MPGKVSRAHSLNRYHVIFGSILAPQNNALEASGEDTLGPLAPRCEWIGRRDDHEHILISLYNSHHANGASFFDVPTKPPIFAAQQDRSIKSIILLQI